MPLLDVSMKKALSLISSLVGSCSSFRIEGLGDGQKPVQFVRLQMSLRCSDEMQHVLRLKISNESFAEELPSVADLLPNEVSK